MKQIAIFIICALSLFVSGCSTARKAATDTKADAQLTAATEGKQHAENTETAAVVTNTTTNERREVVIDFAKVEYGPGDSSEQSDSTAARDWLNAVIGSSDNADEGKAKPPNVKALTVGRVTIAGEKDEQSRTEAQTEQKATKDSEVKQDLQADTHETEKSKTEEKPTFTFWDWLYLGALAAVILGALIWLYHQFHRYDTNQ